MGQADGVNNVETLCNVPSILNHGAEWYHGLSHTDQGWDKIYGVSGRVNHPGAWELPMGSTIREIIDDYEGGMRPGINSER